MDTGSSYIWHLQVSMYGEVMFKEELHNSYTWEVAFPLPIAGYQGE